MKHLVLPIALFSFLLSSCNTTYKNVESFLLMPSGAPTLALYEEVATNNSLIVTTSPNEVKDNFLSNNYKYLVFDVINGIKFEQNNNSNYTFLSLLTGGNFHLIGLNKTITDKPKNNDYIVGFGNENLIPNRVYNKLYNDAPVDYLLPSINDLKNYLNSIDEEGKVASNKIDRIFIAQPALFALSNSNENFKNLLNNSININMREEFNKIFDQKYIPQAGLFVNKKYLEKNKEEVLSFKEKVNKMQLNAIINPVSIKETIHNYSEDLSKQTERFGYNENIAFNLQKDNKNLFGIVNPNDNFSLEDINSFLNILK